MRRTSRSQPARRAVAATIAALALTGLTACNDDDSSATADPAATTTSTAAEDSPTEAAREEPASPAAGETIDPAAFIDDVLGSLADASTAHLSMELQGGPAEMTMAGDIDYSATPPEMSMTMQYAMLGNGDMQVRLVDGVMYMQIPQLGNGKWIKMPLDGKGSPLSGNLVEQLDPGRSLEKMKEAVDGVTYVGDEDVDGETLHHYTIKVRSKAFRDLQDQLDGAGVADLPSVITFDIWTDHDGMMRQTELTMGDLGTVTMTMSDWGEPVDIKAPPAADVMEMPDGSSMLG